MTATDRGVTGTVRDLYYKRQARRNITDTIAAMQRAGMDTTSLQVSLDSLMREEVFLAVPCLVCRRVFAQPANVADDALPYAVICEECDAKVMAQVEAMDKPKRKRRTKAEMEADRLARQGSEGQ
jgi:hypothetical protein